ncbi:MAG: flagellar hook-length control protein FliK [Phycisphaerales bacterium]|nr:MAG: flagellar hook-length control protein FliK [Phycisphaerales bacterium]
MAAGLTGDFRAMLAATCDVSRVADRSLNSTASPTQMFERLTSEPHERRRSALEEDYAASTTRRGIDGRTDSTSVQARRAAGIERASADATRTSALKDDLVGGLRDANVERIDGKAMSSRFDEGLRSSETSVVADSGERSRPRPSSTHPADNNGLHSSHRLEFGQPSPVQPSASFVSQSAAVTAGATLARAGGQQQGGAAQQLAQLLTSTRGGGAESVRVPTSLPAGQDTQAQARQESGVRMAARGERSDLERPAPSSAESRVAKQSEFNRLVRSIRLHASGQNSSARIQLNPPELGRVQVDVRMEGDHLQIGVRAETLEVRELLSQRAAQLHSALEQHGINVERFDVTVDFLGNEPGDQSDGSPLAFASSSEGREKSWHEQSDRASEVSSTDTLDRVDADDGPPTEVAGNTRLDIRI